MAIRFETLTMRNFMPYYGEHLLDFPGSRRVTIIYGNTGTGKTSIFNAINWAWYGKVENRYGRIIPLLNLINRDFTEEGRYTATVIIKFLDESSQYLLTRHLQPKTGIVKPTRDEDFNVTLFLTRDEITLPQTGIQEMLNEILPEDISGFFFFDGERLAQYERLVMDSRTQGKEISEAIEKILGVPALRNTLIDVQQNRQDANRRYLKMANQQKMGVQITAKLDQLEELMENNKTETLKLEDDKKVKLSERTELDILLAQYEELESIFNDRDQLQTELGQLQAEKTELLEGRKKYFSVDKRTGGVGGAWKDLLDSRVRTEDEKRQKRKDEIQVRQLTRIKLENEKDTLGRSLETKRCVHCGAALDAPNQELTRSRLDVVDRELEMMPGDENLEEINTQITILRKLHPPGDANVFAIGERDLRKNKRRAIVVDQQLVEIEKGLSLHNESRIRQNRAHNNELHDQIIYIDLQLTDLNGKREEFDREKRQVEKTLHKTEFGGEGSRLVLEARIYDSVYDIFEKGLEILRDRVKTDVERDATTRFLRLTTQSDYRGLKINDRYGLAIMLDDRTEAPLRSAGNEHIVALSLISALNKNAVRRAPLILDSPFFRLDPKHRANLLRLLPEVYDQVVLLVHEGEIRREDPILNPIKDHIDRQYQIKHPSSTTSSLAVI